jgi:hypothetical protein
MASYTTRDEPRQTFATSRSATPSCQFVPVTKNMAAAASEPTQANPPRIDFWRGERSATAPTTGSRKAEMIVASGTA